MLAQFGSCYKAMMWVKPPLGLYAPAQLFSEGRAMRITSHLSEDIGVRLVRARQAGSMCKRDREAACHA